MLYFWNGGRIAGNDKQKYKGEKSRGGLEHKSNRMNFVNGVCSKNKPRKG